METNNTTAVRYSVDRNGRAVAHRWAPSRSAVSRPDFNGRWMPVSLKKAAAWLEAGRAYVYFAPLTSAEHAVWSL